MKKSEYILSINPCIYGMNYHDPGAAIILDGEILFVGDREEDWITERLDGNSIFTFTICVENPEYSAFGEFGWILMDSPMGYLMRTA